MNKRILSSVIFVFLFFALLYSVYTNLLNKEAHELVKAEYLNEDLFLKLAKESTKELQRENGDVNRVENYPRMEDTDPDVELHYIDEEEALNILEGHTHDHSEGNYEENEPEIQVLNKRSPELLLQSLEGKEVKLSNYRGKKVLINFWATWCPPCKEEMPEIQKYFEEYAKRQNVEVLAINTTDLESSVESVRKFIKEHEITYPILLDEKGEVSLNYEVLTLPTIIIIDENGQMIERIIGPVTEEMLIEKLGS